jgi:glycerol 2-dehydrogenase (NADP+)
MSVPTLKLNTGALMPTIGEHLHKLWAGSGQLTYFRCLGLGVSAGTSKEARSEAHNWVQSALQVSGLNAHCLAAAESLENSQATDTSTLLGYTVRLCDLFRTRETCNAELETENAVGDAIRASGVPRTDVFVTTKLPWHHASRVQESINDSLQKSGLDYFDLVSKPTQPSEICPPSAYHSTSCIFLKLSPTEVCQIGVDIFILVILL